MKTDAWSTKFVVVSCIMSESEEWWFDVRRKAVGKKRPCPVDELCSESSESSSALDAMTARWYEAFETRVTASQSTHRSEWSSPSGTVSNSRAKEEFTAPLVPNVEACAVAVSPAAQEMLAMLRTMLLTASTIVPACERQAKASQATEVQTAISPKFVMPTGASGRTVTSSCSSKRAMACTTRALPFSVTVEQEGFFLSRRPVQLHLQVEHRQSEESTKEFTDAKKNGP